MAAQGETRVRTLLRDTNSGPLFDEAARRLSEFVRKNGGWIESRRLAEVHETFDDLTVGFANIQGLLAAAGCYWHKEGGGFIVSGKPGERPAGAEEWPPAKADGRRAAGPRQAPSRRQMAELRRAEADRRMRRHARTAAAARAVQQSEEIAEQRKAEWAAQDREERRSTRAAAREAERRAAEIARLEAGRLELARHLRNERLNAEDAAGEANRLRRELAEAKQAARTARAEMKRVLAQAREEARRARAELKRRERVFSAEAAALKKQLQAANRSAEDLQRRTAAQADAERTRAMMVEQAAADAEALFEKEAEARAAKKADARVRLEVAEATKRERVAIANAEAALVRIISQAGDHILFDSLAREMGGAARRRLPELIVSKKLHMVEVGGRTVVGSSVPGADNGRYHAAALSVAEREALVAVDAFGAMATEVASRLFRRAGRQVAEAVPFLKHAGFVSAQHGVIRVAAAGMAALAAMKEGEVRHTWQAYRTWKAREVESGRASVACRRMRVGAMGEFIPSVQDPAPKARADVAVLAELAINGSLRIGDIVDATREPASSVLESVIRLAACGCVGLRNELVVPSPSPPEPGDLDGSRQADAYMAAWELGEFSLRQLEAFFRMARGNDGERPWQALGVMLARGHAEEWRQGAYSLSKAGRGYVARMRQRALAAGSGEAFDALARGRRAAASWRARTRPDDSGPVFGRFEGGGALPGMEPPFEWTFPPLPGDPRRFSAAGTWHGAAGEPGASLADRLLDALSAGSLTAAEAAGCLGEDERAVCRAMGALAAARRIKDASHGAARRGGAWKRFCGMVAKAVPEDGKVVLAHVVSRLPGADPAETWSAICFLYDRGAISPGRWSYGPCPEVHVPSDLPGLPAACRREPREGSSEARVLALVRRNPATVAGLAAALGFSKARVYQVLRGLIREGLAREAESAARSRKAGRAEKCYVAEDFDSCLPTGAMGGHGEPPPRGTGERGGRSGLRGTEGVAFAKMEAGPASMQDIAESAGVTRQRADQVLKRLVKEKRIKAVGKARRPSGAMATYYALPGYDEGLFAGYALRIDPVRQAVADALSDGSPRTIAELARTAGVAAPAILAARIAPDVAEGSITLFRRYAVAQREGPKLSPAELGFLAIGWKRRMLAWACAQDGGFTRQGMRAATGARQDELVRFEKGLASLGGLERSEGGRLAVTGRALEMASAARRLFPDGAGEGGKSSA